MNLKEKWKKSSKAGRVGLIAAVAGGSIILVPFIIAAGPLSIVSALAVLGFGTLAAGGLGVAGGIIVTAGGASLSAALAAAIAAKVIKDPDFIELKKNMDEIQELVIKIQLMSKENLGKYKNFREKYIKLGEYVVKELENKKKTDKDTLKRNLFASRDLIIGLKNVK